MIGSPSKYYIMNENTLGYINPNSPKWFGVLHGSVIKGGHNWINGNVFITPTDTLRPATLNDFAEYRCVPPSGFTEDNP